MEFLAREGITGVEVGDAEVLEHVRIGSEGGDREEEEEEEEWEGEEGEEGGLGLHGRACLFVNLLLLSLCGRLDSLEAQER